MPGAPRRSRTNNLPRNTYSVRLTHRKTPIHHRLVLPLITPASVCLPSICSLMETSIHVFLRSLITSLVIRDANIFNKVVASGLNRAYRGCHLICRQAPTKTHGIYLLPFPVYGFFFSPMSGSVYISDVLLGRIPTFRNFIPEKNNESRSAKKKRIWGRRALDQRYPGAGLGRPPPPEAEIRILLF